MDDDDNHDRFKVTWQLFGDLFRVLNVILWLLIIIILLAGTIAYGIFFL